MRPYWMQYVKQDQTSEGGDGGGGTTTPPAATTASAPPPATTEPPAATAPPAGTPPPAATWPETWRTNLAGADEKEAKRLERFASPTEVYRAYRALEQRLSSGELKANTPFPDKGTDAEKNAWRTENGIPETHDKYDLNLGEGIVIGEVDKPIIDSFLQYAHANNQSQDAVKAALGWYFDFQDKQAEMRAQSDEQATQRTTDALRAEYGPEYRGNVNRIMGMLDTAPPGVKDKMMGARGPDGTPLFADADAVRFFVNLAREINPATTLTGPNGSAASVDDEIGKLDKMMADRSSDYWKGPKVTKNGVEDTVMAHRYRELVAARENLKKRSA